MEMNPDSGRNAAVFFDFRLSVTGKYIFLKGIISLHKKDSGML